MECFEEFFNKLASKLNDKCEGDSKFICKQWSGKDFYIMNDDNKFDIEIVGFNDMYGYPCDKCYKRLKKSRIEFLDLLYKKNSQINIYRDIFSLKKDISLILLRTEELEKNYSSILLRIEELEKN